MSDATDARRKQKLASWRGIVSSRKYLDAPDAEFASTHQAIYHFTRDDQIDSLLAARETDPNCGFMARMLALCSLPRTNPGDQLQYVRRNGPFTLYMTVSGSAKLPYGNIPRLLLAWVCTEAVRTQNRELVLGDSLSAFMRSVGVYNTGGSVRSRLQDQMRRLFNVHVQLRYEHEHGEVSVNSQVADRTEFWWSTTRPDDRTLWESKIELGEKFFKEIIRHPVPLDMNILKAMKRSTLGLDLYLWLTYRTFALKRPLRLSWPRLYRQFGSDPAKVNDTRRAVDNFRTDCLRELKKIKTAWPDLHYRVERGRRGEKTGRLILQPSPPRIQPAELRLVE